MTNEKSTQRKPTFCTPMERNYITKASSNVAKALSMAKEIHAYDMAGMLDIGYAIQDLVNIIDDVSIRLIRQCNEVARQK